MFLKTRLGAVLVASIFALPASAATIGTTVDGFGPSPADVGNTAYRAALGAEAVEYYIPLPDDGTCTYGVDCGTSSDSGDGTNTGTGTTMSMYLEFDGVSTTQESVLTVAFEDLDLNGVNDPSWFWETVQVFDEGGALTGLITDIASPLVSGDYDTQQFLSFSLGVLTDTTHYLRLEFTARSLYHARNTPEYLVAEISAVPLPASALLLIGGLAGLGTVARRRKKA